VKRIRRISQIKSIVVATGILMSIGWTSEVQAAPPRFPNLARFGAAISSFVSNLTSCFRRPQPAPVNNAADVVVLNQGAVQGSVSSSSTSHTSQSLDPDGFDMDIDPPGNGIPALQNEYDKLPPENEYGQAPPENDYGQAPPENEYGQGPPELVYDRVPDQPIYDEFKRPGPVYDEFKRPGPVYDEFKRPGPIYDEFKRPRADSAPTTRSDSRDVNLSGSARSLRSSRGSSSSSSEGRSSVDAQPATSSRMNNSSSLGRGAPASTRASGSNRSLAVSRSNSEESNLGVRIPANAIRLSSGLSSDSKISMGLRSTSLRVSLSSDEESSNDND
jgi:hypothetical protein